MRLLIFGLVFLCISSVLPNSIEGNVAEESLVDEPIKKEKTCIKCVTDQSEEEEETDPSETGSINPDAATSNFERRQRWKKKWLHRREKNRFMDHHHHHHHHDRWSKKAKRIEERKNRLASDKKKPSNKIQYLERSSRIDQQNDAVDGILALFSQTLNNETFHLKLDKPNSEMKIVPWTFIQLDSTTSSGKRITSESVNANKLDAPEAETDSVVEDNEEDANTEDESKVSTNTEDESQSSAEVKTTKEGLAKPTDDDEDDDDDDEEEETVSGTAANPNCLENNKPFQLVSNLSSVALPDGATEYYVKLLSQQEIYCRNRSSIELSTELQENEGQERRMSRKQRRAHGRRRSRKTFSKVLGIELLERSGDVMIGAKENSTARVVDVQMQIGPFTFVMDRKAAYPFKNSRVAFPALMARLRLKVWDGKLILSAKFKPQKIQSSEAVVTLQLKEGDEFPSNQDVVARVVGYLSQETTNAWNSGYLIRRLKRQFKSIYIGKMGHKKGDFANEDAKKLVKLLLESITVEKQPSTEHPVTEAPALNVENVESLSVFTTSRPLLQ